MKFLPIACYLTLASTVLYAAPPSASYFYPAGGQAGQTIETTVEGKLPPGTKAWTNIENIKFEFPEKGNKIKVVVPAETKPGVCWIRFYNEEGTSPLKPFPIGSIPETVEKEPNNELAKAQKLDSLPVMMNGVLNKGGEVDTFAVSLKSGQTLIASMVANEQLGSPMDAVLQIVSPRGFVLEQNDDDHGFDPQVVYTAKSDGTHYIRAFAFPSKPNSSIALSGAASYVYRLTLTTGAFINHAYPMTVTHGAKANLKLTGWNIPQGLSSIDIDTNVEQPFVLIHRPELTNAMNVQVARHATVTEADQNDVEHPQAVEIPSTITGCIEKSNDIDAYSVTAKKGQKLRFRCESHKLGFPLDPVLRLVDATGKVLKNVETRSITALDESLEFTASADGQYQIQIRDVASHGGFRFIYRLLVEEQKPDYTLSVAADNFVLDPAKPLEIPITVTRTAGFAEEVTVTITDLPAGVTVEPVKSESKGASSKSVKLALKAKNAKPFSGLIRINGKSNGETPVERPATTALTGSTEKTANLWLTVLKPKPKKK